MPITPNPPFDTLLVHQLSSRVPSSNFTLSAPPVRKRPVQRAPIPSGLVANQQPCKPTSPVCSSRSSPNSRRRASVTLRSPLSSFLSFVDSPENTIRRNSAYGIGLGVPGARLSPSALNTIVAFASGKSHRRSVSGPLPGTAWSFETHFAPSPTPTALSLTHSPTSSTPTPIHVLFERTRTLAALKAKPQDSSSTPTKPRKSKARPTPVMATKDGHVNVLLLPRRRDKDLAPSIKSNTSASTGASKSKSRKDAQSLQASSSSTKTPRAASNPALRAQRSLTPAREAFRPLPYATHAALDEFFGDPRKMNALHAHQSASNQLGARPEEVGYGNTVGHKGADGWIWFDALEEQEYAWLMSDSGAPHSPETPRAPPKEKKKPKRRGLLGRRGSATSESEGGRTDWESFDALRRGSESSTSESGVVDPMTYDLDPTRPPRYRIAADGSARYRVDGTAWDAAVHVRGRQNVGGTSTPKSRRGRSRRGSASQANAAERRRPPPLNLAAVSSTLAALSSQVAPAARSPINLSARRGSLPILSSHLPPSLADLARADFVSSSFQPNPSKRDLNLDPETPWSANLPKDTIYKTIGSTMVQTPVSAAPGSPFKSMFSRRASLTPFPVRHSPLPLPQSNSGLSYELKGDGSLPKLPPMPMENGAPAPGAGEPRRKASLADIFRRGFSSRGRK